MRAPYADAPGSSGRLNLPAERIDQFVGWAYGTEDPLAVHAVGDGAIEAYVAAVERGGRPEVWRAKRPRIEHGDMLAPDLIPRVKAMGMLVVQNPTHFTFPEIFLARYGQERARVDAADEVAARCRHSAGDRIGWADESVPQHHGGDDASDQSEGGADARAGGDVPTRPAPPSRSSRNRRKAGSRSACWPTSPCCPPTCSPCRSRRLEAIRSVMTMFGGRIVHETGVGALMFSRSAIVPRSTPSRSRSRRDQRAGRSESRGRRDPSPRDRRRRAGAAVHQREGRGLSARHQPVRHRAPRRARVRQASARVHQAPRAPGRNDAAADAGEAVGRARCRPRPAEGRHASAGRRGRCAKSSRPTCGSIACR